MLRDVFPDSSLLEVGFAQDWESFADCARKASPDRQFIIGSGVKSWLADSFLQHVD